jgi:hypothetical protein
MTSSRPTKILIHLLSVWVEPTRHTFTLNQSDMDPMNHPEERHFVCWGGMRNGTGNDFKDERVSRSPED